MADQPPPKAAIPFPTSRKPRSVDLYSADVIPIKPAFTVDGWRREHGLGMLWAQPGGLKTHTALLSMNTLLLDSGPPTLFGCPFLHIRRRYKRALWIATEESAGILRYKADEVVAGLKKDRITGEFRFIYATELKQRVTLLDLESILGYEGPFDGVILDSLTGLRPRNVGAKNIEWDRDNDAANDMCLMLRGIAYQFKTDIEFLHHTGRDTSKGYRGPTDWWASVDTMIGLTPAEGGLTKVIPQKNRDGILLKPFFMRQTWGQGSFALVYDSEAADAETFSKGRIHSYMVAFGPMTCPEIVKELKVSRSTVKRSLADATMFQPTGEERKQSPEFKAVPA